MVEIAVPILRTALYASSALLVGGLLFVLLAWPEGYRSTRMHALVRRAWVGVLVSSLGVVLAHGALVFDTGLWAALDPAVITSVAETTFGKLGWLRVVITLLMGIVVWKLVGSRFDSPLPMAAILVGSGALTASLSLSGHALARGPLVVAVDMVHLFAAFAWLGGLFVLMAVVLPTRRSEELAVTVPAFSSIAFTSVILLVVTGTFNGILQLGTLESLTDSGYGRWLSIKVVAFLVLLGLGGLSRRWVKSRYDTHLPVVRTGDGREMELRRGLRRTVMIEVAVGVAVLGLTAMLVTTSPPQESALDTITPTDSIVDLR